ncbi:MAG: MMPL family transporter [Candidatus Binatia bacterium]
MIAALVRAGFLAFLVFLAVFCARRVDFGSDITNFMPDAKSADLALLANYMAKGDLARTMFLTVGTRSGAHDDQRIAAAVSAMAAKLRTHPEVAWLRIAPEDTDLEKVWNVYFPRRFSLVSLDPEREIAELTSEAAIARQAVQAREALASSAGTLVKRTLPPDPLGFFGRILDRMREESPTLDVRRGVFFARDGYGVAILATRSSAFDSSRQAPLLRDIADAFAAANRDAGGDLVLETSGVNRFAVATEASLKRDMWWIGGASFVGISLLFLAFFRSLSWFLIALLPTVAGLLVPTALGTLLFDRLDGLTIAFGASLIGTTIDYPTHLLNHFAMLGGGRRATIAHLAPSISMGAMTTMASFAGLALTAFPGFRQLAFFSTVGVAAALATTLLVVPYFVPESSQSTRAAGATARVLGRIVGWLRRHRRVLASVPVLVLLLAAAALPVVRWEDDLSQLGSVDPALESEERRVRERVSPLEMGRAVMVMAGSEEEALLRTEEITRRLDQLRDAGAITGFRTAAGLVWSRELQERNRKALDARTDLADRVDAGFAAAGFRADVFAPFRKDLAAPWPQPLMLADLEGTGLENLVKPMIIEFDEQFATISYVREPRDEAAVRAAMHEIPGARYFVQRDFVNDLYAEFRTANLQQVLIGSVLVVLVLFARYRRWRPTAAAFLPSAMVPIIVLSVLALCGVAINLLHVVSVIMVMGMGTDFGIFMVDSHHDPKRFEATLVSLVLCCLTTVATFAVLAISAHPALRAMGMTTGLSVVLALVLAPVSLVVIEPRTGRGA